MADIDHLNCIAARFHPPNLRGGEIFNNLLNLIEKPPAIASDRLFRCWTVLSFLFGKPKYYKYAVNEFKNLVTTGAFPLNCSQHTLDQLCEYALTKDSRIIKPTYVVLLLERICNLLIDSKLDRDINTAYVLLFLILFAQNNPYENLYIENSKSQLQALLDSKWYHRLNMMQSNVNSIVVNLIKDINTISSKDYNIRSMNSIAFVAYILLLVELSHYVTKYNLYELEDITKLNNIAQAIIKII